MQPQQPERAGGVGRQMQVGPGEHRAYAGAPVATRVEQIEAPVLIGESADQFDQWRGGAGGRQFRGYPQEAGEGLARGDGLLGVVALQIDVELAVGEPVPDPVRPADGERGLADAGGAGHCGDGHHRRPVHVVGPPVGVVEQLVELGQLGDPAGEVGDVGWQLGRCRFGRCPAGFTARGSDRGPGYAKSSPSPVVPNAAARNGLALYVGRLTSTYVYIAQHCNVSCRMTQSNCRTHRW
ncbi:hypothetical protein ACFHWS_13345 [Micromonospora sp. LOL_013]